MGRPSAPCRTRSTTTPVTVLSLSLSLSLSRSYSATEVMVTCAIPMTDNDDRTSYNSPQELSGSTRDEIAWYTNATKVLAPGAQVWAGEDGPIGGGNDGTYECDLITHNR